MPRKRTRLEASIEQAVVVYARSHKVIVRKMNGLGNRAWPDRMFLHKGKVLFIEFKREGCKPTALQAKFHKLLQEHGFSVRVVDDVELGKVCINDWLSGHAVNTWPSLAIH